MDDTNTISLQFPLKVNDEIIIHPRRYSGALFQLYSGTDNSTIYQNTIHTSQPIATFFSETKEVIFYGDVTAQNLYNKSFFHFHNPVFFLFCNPARIPEHPHAHVVLHQLICR